MNRLFGLGIATVLSTGLAHGFGGAMVGAELGGTYVRADHTYEETIAAISYSGYGENSISKLGFATGAFAEYLHEIGNSKTFIGGGLHFGTAFYEEKCSFGVDGQPVVGKVKIQRKFGLKPNIKVGKLINPKVMVYGAVGYEFAKFDFDYTFNTTTPLGAKVTKNLKAFVPAAGLLYKVSDNFIVGAEYGYAAYGKKNIGSASGTVSLPTPPGGTGTLIAKTRADLSEHRILVSLAFRFCPF